MARRHGWDNEIDHLPPEILSYNIGQTPRTTLKDIANKLNAESVSAGNWESLAEKLGFLENSVVDNLTQQAKVQNTYPGLLMLQEWARRSGSTAHVLLHALREIQREDAVGVLVDKLFELHTMQLLISVQEGTGPPKFLRVATQKSAPLHASLDNTLSKPPYWYDIVGPRHDINWNTPSGILQGAQLSLRLRVEPSQNSMSEIYGTTASLCHPPPVAPVRQLALNILPEQHTQASEGHGASQNDLSSNQLSGSRREVNVLQSPPAVSFPLHPPPFCGAEAVEPQNPDSALNRCEPLSSIGLRRSEGLQQQCPNFNALMSSTESGFEFSAPPVDVSSLESKACNVEYRPCSYTGVKQPVVPQVSTELDETLLKESAKHFHENANTGASDKGMSAHENTKVGATEHDETAFGECAQVTDTNKFPVTACSYMHTDYITHDNLIQFCNNPTSPQSLGSDSSSAPSAAGSDVNLQPCVEAQRQGASSGAVSRMVNAGDYVPVTFFEKQSQSFDKTASASGVNKEENMQTDQSDADIERMDITDSSLRKPPAKSEISSTFTTAHSDTDVMNKPRPCTYSMYRPDSQDYEPHQKSQSRPIPHSVSLDNEPGYMDMTGIESAATQPRNQAPTLAGMHPCMSVDSYMNTRLPDFNLHNASTGHILDSSARNMSTPNLDHLLHSRNRRPLPTGGDVFQPRDRRPLTHDHELLLDEPEPEYTYIEAKSASDDLPRRSSAGAMSTSDCPGSARTPRDTSNGAMASTDGRPGYTSSACGSDLPQVPGWNPYITERTIDHEMSRYINDDGNFIVWRYEVGGKYVISVSHLRSIRHYAVYESEREGRVYYYIFPKGARFKSLLALIQHCQKHGVTEPTKTFKTPDGKKTHRSSGRFSHVRLRTPIPARKN